MRIHKITRRNFMKAAGVSALAMGLAACGGTLLSSMNMAKRSISSCLTPNTNG